MPAGTQVPDLQQPSGVPAEPASRRSTTAEAAVVSDAASAGVLSAFLERHARIAVLTGAGCSTGSGIPDYRNDDGSWKHRRPVQYADFIRSADVRRNYWARSFHGWQRIAGAVPNAAHTAIARLENAGRIAGIITQNVDDLHRRAGSRKVVDLHGILSRTRCVQCGATLARNAFQSLLERHNPHWRIAVTQPRPDGDSMLAANDPGGFNVPACPSCDGIVKPDVVFFGESVPASRVARAGEIVTGSDALLVVGSSLMVFSGFRLVRMAATAGLPIVIVNRGVTRADGLARFRLVGDCATILARGVAAIGA
jgi:NAD-dependent SIR2 family protein deacetylase